MKFREGGRHTGCEGPSPFWSGALVSSALPAPSTRTCSPGLYRTPRALLQPPARTFPGMKSLQFLRAGNVLILLNLISSGIHLRESLRDWKAAPDGRVFPPLMGTQEVRVLSLIHSLCSLSICYMPDAVILPSVTCSDRELTTSRGSPASLSQETHH